jgi:hypothetical protein
MISDDDIQFLNDNRTHYDTLVNAGYLRGLSGETRTRMQDIIRRYWDGGYHTDLWCAPCVSTMLKKLYGLYDEWIAKEAITVQATFPSNKID